MLSPVAWRTPPRDYGPWEQVVSLLTEGLVKRGVDVTLFATGDSSEGRPRGEPGLGAPDPATHSSLSPLIERTHVLRAR